tara:strand:+ start:9727 stop:10653 length:927 start_codon:yes stop_codon:yes gene_type:complete
MILNNKNRKLIKILLFPILKHFRPGNVAMFHLGRCGSTVLAKMIQKTKGVYWHGEIFGKILRDVYKGNKNPIDAMLHEHDFIKSNFNNDLYWKEILSEIGADKNNIINKKYNKQIIKLILSYIKIAGINYYGFEFKPFNNKVLNLEIVDFINELENLGINYFIILDRKNRLRKIISSLIAHNFSDKWHYSPNDNVKRNNIFINPEKIEIDFDSKPLIDYLIDYDNKFNELNRILYSKSKLLKLYYEEDIQKDPNKAYHKVCKFLGVKMRSGGIPLKPTNPFPIESMVSNFEVLEAYLKNSSYEWMLYD